MSYIWQLNWKDLLNGLITAVFGGIATFIYQLIDPCLDSFIHGISCSITFQWSSIVLVAFGSGIAYLIKRFSSDNQGNVLGIGGK